jgi:bacillithiol synthase
MVWKALREYDTVSAEPTASVKSDASAPAVFAAGASRVGLDVRRCPWLRPLADDYANHYDRVASLYAGDPRSAAAWKDAIDRAQHHPRDRAAISRIVGAQQERRSAPAAARAAAALLAEPQAVAIVTGQQAGAFGGPMFTLLKAITALQLARQTHADHKTPVVAVFWVDAEDHDWDEVASVTVLDKAFQPRSITVAAPEGAGELPVAALTLEPSVDEAIAALAAALPTTEFTEGLLATFRSAYHSGGRMADAFARWLEQLLGPHGLVVFESSDPAAKPLVADVFTREIGAPGRTATLTAAAGDQLAALGHDPQVAPQADSVSLFRLDPERHAIRRQGDAFVAGERTFTSAQLLDEATNHPERFSPNVLLRPIVQDTLFPTIAYVAGPSELAYLGQLGGVYRQFGVPMPLMYPRAMATIIDSGAARFLGRYEVRFEDLQAQDESALNRLLESQLPEAVERAMREAEDSIRRSMERVAAALPSLDPTLAGAAKTTLGKMEHDLKGLHTKVIHAAKRRDETLRRQFTRAQAQFFPSGHPQERTLGIVYFLNRYGPALVDRLLAELPVDLGKHWVLTI